MLKSATHRALLYWFFLLLPTLAAAGGALWLLHREQLRIDEQYHVAVEGRKTAVNDRARLIAESVEILVIDIQNGLMSTLMEAPSDGPASFLSNWKTANPLVGDVFQSTDDGRIRWGKHDDAVASWLHTAPWKSPNQKDLMLPELEDQFSRGGFATTVKLLPDEDAALKTANNKSNSNQYFSQRHLVQNISLRNASPSEAETTYESEFQNTDEGPVQAFHQGGNDWNKLKPQGDSNGWASWYDNNKMLHILGWRLCSNGTVLVVDVNMQTLEEQLGQMLPQIIPENESYSLLRADGSTVNQVTGIGNSSVALKAAVSKEGLTESANVPLSEQTLPNWSVSGTFLSGGGSVANGKTFFLSSAVFVALFVCTILSGSGLLLRQARISEMESRQKTTFVANVSHELKTPLTSIRLHAELLEQNRVRDEEQRTNFLNAIGRETQRLTRLVNNVLDFSRLEQGHRKPSLENVGIVRELNAILDCHAPRIEEAGLTLKRSFPEKEVFLATDSDALEQIIINLIDNACKYAASGRELEVALTQADGGRVKIAVADRGLGIPASHRKRIFEKFHRIDNSLTAEQGGAGLGLSIAYQLALTLGGDLYHENRKNGGSKFMLVFSGVS